MSIFLIGVGSIVLCFGTPIAIAVSVVFAFKRRPLKKPLLSILACFFGGFIIALAGGIMSGDAESNSSESIVSEESSDDLKAAEDAEREAEKEAKLLEKEKKKAEQEAEKERKKAEKEAEKERKKAEKEAKKKESEEQATAEEVIEEKFYENFISNFQDYDGKKVKTTILVSSCTNFKKEHYITSSFDGNDDFIEVYTKEENNYDQGDYITVVGTLEKGDYEYEMHDSEIIATGSEAENNWNNEFEEYLAYFSENSDSPSYDDLMRYPDTYKNKRIILQLKIKDVKPDGIIFDGNITAELNGQEVLVSDKRESREPRLQTGDTITAYSYGGGLATVKVKDGSGIFASTVDKYNIPQVNVRYLEIK